MTAIAAGGPWGGAGRWADGGTVDTAGSLYPVAPHASPLWGLLGRLLSLCYSGDIPSKLQLPWQCCLVDHLGGFAVGKQMRGISLFPLVP